MRRPSEAIWQILLLLLIILLIVIIAVSVRGAPQGITVISNTTENFTGNSPAQVNASGGTITTINFNATQQTYRWKGYVGNVTGKVALRDSNNYSLYDWSITSITGEVYASRANAITWTAVNCTNATIMASENTALGINSSSIDSINNTFNGTTHRSFYVGTQHIVNSTCPSIATNVNNTAQSLSESSYFQEVLLDDDTAMIYTTILELDITGFDSQSYDFQLIVADSESESTATTYYFWAELV
ncbi:hypothetical protein C4573_04945 [Candidatus Woesearchaeota archaeon]|nr:MAG: hypothetical protein C4573_04945 [Candidatus Woesearchaeota archaeon]